jgi:N-methylhydantoinase A/oxoprolinase/acetone carboxylase beta subunit
MMHACDACCRLAMEEIARLVNKEASAAGQPHKSVDEVAMGFLRVANETMCRPIRALTQMRVCISATCFAFPGIDVLNILCMVFED